MTREELIAALEKAEGPSRILDAEIYGFLHPSAQWVNPAERIADAPQYTRSIIGALTLVPEGWWYLLGKGKTHPREPLYGAQIINPGTENVVVLAEAEHPNSLPLALCIAALKARAKEE